MKIDVRTIEAGSVKEFYITAIPSPQGQTGDQIGELFTAVADKLKETSSRIMQERVFLTAGALETVRSRRTEIYGKLDDGVSPTWLIAEEGIYGQIAAVQIHAVSGCSPLEILEYEGQACGRIVKMDEMSYVTLSNIRQPELPTRSEQAAAMLRKAEAILKTVGGDFFDVPRTWMWLDNILDWYDDFNQVRNEFFAERGILARGNYKMPASTGIGLASENGSFSAMELAAVIGDGELIEYVDAGGNQQSAYDYGSAFSRAATAKTPAGYAIFVSGTASIDADGNTTNLDDAKLQIADTIQNVQAVLAQCGCSDTDIVQAMAYSKTPEIEKLFNEQWPDLQWPIISAIADVCRDDLLFEIEVIAAKNA
jgi:enamine deaminase RidA (YjgF/YER057c/UK114 family)